MMMVQIGYKIVRFVSNWGSIFDKNDKLSVLYRKYTLNLIKTDNFWVLNQKILSYWPSFIYHFGLQEGETPSIDWTIREIYQFWVNNSSFSIWNNISAGACCPDQPHSHPLAHPIAQHLCFFFFLSPFQDRSYFIFSDTARWQHFFEFVRVTKAKFNVTVIFFFFNFLFIGFTFTFAFTSVSAFALAIFILLFFLTLSFAFLYDFITLIDFINYVMQRGGRGYGILLQQAISGGRVS